MKVRLLLVSAFLVLILMLSAPALANTQFYGQYDMNYNMWSPYLGVDSDLYNFVEIGSDYSRRDDPEYTYLPVNG